ncbi:hypothetical protein GGI42DRAFT_337344 [Trichoderma sp. SZMC 28013]
MIEHKNDLPLQGSSATQQSFEHLLSNTVKQEKRTESHLDKQVKRYPDIIKILIFLGIVSALNLSLRSPENNNSSEICAVLFSVSAIITEFSSALAAALLFGHASLSDGKKGSRAWLIYWGPIFGASISGCCLIVGEIFWHASGYSRPWGVGVLGFIAGLLAVITSVLIYWMATTRKQTRSGVHEITHFPASI